MAFYHIMSLVSNKVREGWVDLLTRFCINLFCLLKRKFVVIEAGKAIAGVDHNVGEDISSALPYLIFVISFTQTGF